MGRRAEFVIRRDPEPFDSAVKLRQQPALRREAVDHLLLSPDLLSVERNRRARNSASRRRPGPLCQRLCRWISGSRLAPGRERQKAAGYELAIAAMIKSH